MKKNLNTDEQLQLQREINQLDLILKGYENENQKLMKKDRSLNEEVKELNAKLQQ